MSGQEEPETAAPTQSSRDLGKQTGHPISVNIGANPLPVSAWIATPCGRIGVGRATAYR